MFPDPNSGDRDGIYAVVSYIPEPLAGFLDRLRQELVPNCFLRAHITILPPRPNQTSIDIAWQQLRELAPRFRPFDVELTNVEIFANSDVLYLNAGAGKDQLHAMHHAMDSGGLKFKERFAYQPHITLAQDLKTDQLEELLRVARQRWADYKYERTFPVDSLTFVRSPDRKVWTDLYECKLGAEGDMSYRIFQPDGHTVLHP